MNATPADARAARTGRPGEASCRDVAIILVPPIGTSASFVAARAAPSMLAAGRPGGLRHARTAGRRVLDARLDAPGRAGAPPRQVASLLASHPLLAASSLRLRDSENAHVPPQDRTGDWRVRGFSRSRLRRLAQQDRCVRPNLEAQGARLLPNECGACVALAPGASRGKGVRAA